MSFAAIVAGAPFFFADGEGDGLALGVSLDSGVAAGLAEGDGDFSGLADGFADGDFSASSFFFGAAELLRCFRGAGVGVGARIFLILVPNDSSACDRSAMPNSIATKKSE